jgi:hypothetical protein
VLPGALIFGLLLTFPLHWVLYFTLAHGETISGVNIGPIESILSPFVVAIGFIIAGSRIAPNYKLKASIVLFVIWLLMVAGSALLALSGSNLLGHQLYLKGSGVSSILAVVGASIGLYFVKTEEKK